MALVSLILCTRNRAADLRGTLEVLARLPIPDGLAVELVLVDNNSTDATADVAAAAARPLAHLSPRRICETRAGLSHARNAGIAAARGDVLLFSDDDVRPVSGWIEAMCAPLLSGKAHGVAGGVRIAAHLERPWMESVHRAYLASTDGLRPEAPGTMVGANMAFARAVLSRVPGFDAELGAGRLGMAEESLFAHQLLEAGYRIVSAFDACVEHHFDPSRLLRKSFLDSAKKLGRSWAYVAYHWEHFAPSPHRPLHVARSALRLGRWRLRHPGARRGRAEGCAPREMELVKDLFFYRQLRLEERRARCYDRHGLIKRAGVPQ